jgi:glycerol uptake facilitator-like aquaporin
MANSDPPEDSDHISDLAVPNAPPEPSNGRRDFLRTTVTVALGVGAVAVVGESKASAAPAGATTSFSFDSKVVPAALTPANIKKITDAIAAGLAQEAKAGLESVPATFHLRIGGGHSRVFSKTAGHKNVGHSEVIIDGSFP